MAKKVENEKGFSFDLLDVNLCDYNSIFINSVEEVINLIK